MGPRDFNGGVRRARIVDNDLFGYVTAAFEAAREEPRLILDNHTNGKRLRPEGLRGSEHDL
jgi:hypothetical protein